METPPHKSRSSGTNGGGDVKGSSPHATVYEVDKASQMAYKEDTTAPANRQGIDDVLRSFGELMTASRRPLPTQNGDGTYNTAKKQTGLRKDLKVIKLKGEYRSNTWLRGESFRLTSVLYRCEDSAGGD
jgi:hypothetical protein